MLESPQHAGAYGFTINGKLLKTGGVAVSVGASGGTSGSRGFANYRGVETGVRIT